MGFFNKAKQAVSGAVDSVKRTLGFSDLDESAEVDHSDIEPSAREKAERQPEPSEPAGNQSDDLPTLTGPKEIGVPIADDSAENGVRIEYTDRVTGQDAAVQAARHQEGARRKPRETIEVNGETVATDRIADGYRIADDSGIVIHDY